MRELRRERFSLFLITIVFCDFGHSIYPQHTQTEPIYLRSVLIYLSLYVKQSGNKRLFWITENEYRSLAMSSLYNLHPLGYFTSLFQRSETWNPSKLIPGFFTDASLSTSFPFLYYNSQSHLHVRVG